MLCGWVLYCVTVTKAMFLIASALDITLSYECRTVIGGEVLSHQWGKKMLQFC